MIDFDMWWNSAAADGFRAEHEKLSGEIFRHVWDAAMLAAAPSPAAEGAKVAAMPLDLLSVRRAFEAWSNEFSYTVETINSPPDSTDPCYSNSYQKAQWEVWKACHAILPKPAEVLSDARIDEIVVEILGLDADQDSMQEFARAIERAVLAQPSGGDERADFEAWYRREYWNFTENQVSFSDGQYGHLDVQLGWASWQAALSQQQGRDAELWQAIRDMLSQRVGELPARGWLRDNDRTRQAVARIAAIAAARGE